MFANSFFPTFIGGSISSISMWYIVNQLGKRDFSCEQIFLVGRLEREETFLIKWIEIVLI